MNFDLAFLPPRSQKPRESGLTLMTDRGLSVREAENFCEGSAPYTDFVKMAFGTSLLIPSLEAKLNIYHEAGIRPYFGGTLFEVFARRNALDSYRSYLDRFGIEYLEISDSVIELSRQQKCEEIKSFTQDFEVISETTNQLRDRHLSFDEYLDYMQEELEAGARYVLVKESHQMPLYGRDGLAFYLNCGDGKGRIDLSKVLWDAPAREQQIELINGLGNEVNLSNIAFDAVLALESKRLGLHSSTLLRLIPEVNH